MNRRGFIKGLGALLATTASSPPGHGYAGEVFFGIDPAWSGEEFTAAYAAVGERMYWINGAGHLIEVGEYMGITIREDHHVVEASARGGRLPRPHEPHPLPDRLHRVARLGDEDGTDPQIHALPDLQAVRDMGAKAPQIEPEKLTWAG